MLFPVSLVGSYPQPDWLIDRAGLAGHSVPRVRAKHLWRIPEPYLLEAQRDATLVAIREQEEAGLDIVTDGEIRRESYFNRFATALDGIDIEHAGSTLSRGGRPVTVPRIVGPIRRLAPVEVEDMAFLRAHTRRLAKITLPGPFTMTQLAQDDYYGDEEGVAMAYAQAVNEEMRDLFAAGADIVQIDEPYMQAQPEKARRYAVKAINRALDGIEGTTVVHMCFGYAAMVGSDKPNRYAFLDDLRRCDCKQVSLETAQPRLDCSTLGVLDNKKVLLGVIDLSDMTIESDVTVAERIEAALPYVRPENIIVAPDCGMKYLPREVAYGKMRAMVEGARLARERLRQAAPR
ncbi:MAG: 5-methyltetrahydropteroyltriglutamate--homocysteine methyltransferase [Betaproteobacteria bacterium]|nr:MAG: 5-methyltetrahydropteroyltriglutamate--homocysteine methyltransferase [Betaproteobacteria bacterium]